MVDKNIIGQFCWIGKDCYLNGDRLSKNAKKLLHLHKITKKGFKLVKNMGLYLYILSATEHKKVYLKPCLLGEFGSYAIKKAAVDQETIFRDFFQKSVT